MVKKKKEEVKQEPQIKESPCLPQDAQSAEPEKIYLVDTLMTMDEIKGYGLNQYFLRAILKNKFYTLNSAKRLIEEAMK